MHESKNMARDAYTTVHINFTLDLSALSSLCGPSFDGVLSQSLMQCKFLHLDFLVFYILFHISFIIH